MGIVIKTDQPLGTLAVALLEPSGESSFFFWGFFASRFTSHEYPENYIMIPLAEYMLNQSEALAAEWEAHQIENPEIVGIRNPSLIGSSVVQNSMTTKPTLCQSVSCTVNLPVNFHWRRTSQVLENSRKAAMGVSHLLHLQPPPLSPWRKPPVKGRSLPIMVPSAYLWFV